MIELGRRLRTFLVHLSERVVRVRWIVLSAALAGIGALNVFVATPPWINVSLAAVSVALILLDVRNHRIAQRRISFPERPSDDFADVRKALAHSEHLDFLQIHDQTFVLDRWASLAISQGKVIGQLAGRPYAPRPELREFGGRYRREAISRNAAIFNGPVLGWRGSTEPKTLGDTPIDLIPARFFDRLAADDLSNVDVRWDGETTIIHGRKLFIDRRGLPRDLGSSWLVNAIGVSTLAVSLDGMLLITAQSTKNVRSSGLLAPSGSGSLEPRDLGRASHLRMDELAIAGANRELAEETSVQSKDIDASFFLGFGRWLNKSATPELFTVTFLNIDSHTVRGRKRHTEERVYVDGVTLIRPTPLTEWNPAEPASVLPIANRDNISLPLGIALALLASEVHSARSQVGQKLRRYLEDLPAPRTAR